MFVVRDLTADDGSPRSRTGSIGWESPCPVVTGREDSPCMQLDDEKQPKRRLLTFRLDRDLGHRLKGRLGADGRTLSDVVVQGLRLYVEHGDVVAEPEPATADAPEPKQTTAVSESLELPGHVAAQLRNLRSDGQSDLLSATLAALHEAGWPLRPLGEALGISRQAVQARTRRQVPAEIRSLVAPCAPPPPYPRRRPGAPGAPRRPFTVKVDPALRSAARTKAGQEGMSLTEIVHRILDRYLRHGTPAEPREILLGDTTPTRPSRRGPA
jgi:hypothetical protein